MPLLHARDWLANISVALAAGVPLCRCICGKRAGAVRLVNSLVFCFDTWPFIRCVHRLGLPIALFAFPRRLSLSEENKKRFFGGWQW